MSWDDEDFEVPTAKKDTAVMESWEDEDDEPLLNGDSWDVDEDEEKKKKNEELKKKKQQEEAVKKAAADKKAKLRDHAKELDSMDPAKRKQLLKQHELEADLNNAADLFGGLGVADEHPRAKALRVEQEAAAKAKEAKTLTVDTPITDHPLFTPETKQDYERLRKELTPVFQELADKSLINYSNSLAIDLVRDVVKPMSVENMRKVVSTLNVVIRDRERADRQARLSKAGGTSTGGAGKKKGKGKVNLGGAFKKDDFADTTNYDDLDDDDFM